MVLTLLICLSSITILPDNFKVKADSEEFGLGGAGGAVGLDYVFMYDALEELSEIILDSEHGKDYNIFKGRVFGAKGEQYAADLIEDWLYENTDNLNVSKIVKERIGDENYSIFDLMRNVNNKMEVLGYGLSFRNATSGSPNATISNNESFPYPSWTLSSYYQNITVDSGGYIDIKKPCVSWDGKSGSEMDFSPLNVTEYDLFYNLLNCSGSIIGEVTYIDNYSNVSYEEKAGKIHLINVSDEDFNSTIEMLEECNASGFILIRDDFSTVKNWSINISGLAVSTENGSLLKNLSLNGTGFTFPPLTDNVPSSGDMKLFHRNDTYPICNEKIYLINSSWAEWYWGDFIAYNWIVPDPWCIGFLFCDSDHPQTHFMFPVGSANTLPGSFSRLIRPALSINGSILVDGEMKDFLEWFEENKDTDHCVKASYWIKQRKDPEVESYNVYCDVVGKNTDKTIILSGGHYEGWWGQETIDDGAGVAQMFGILKYLNDSGIVPKCNLRFIFHGGHEHVLRGSWSHVLNSSNSDVLDQTDYIVNLDQLAHHFHNSAYRINTSNVNLKPVLWLITEDSKYNETYVDKNYYVNVGETLIGYKSNDAIPYAEENSGFDIEHINFAKNNFKMYHRSGKDHTLGDSMNVLDRENLNVTADILWNITKYLIVDPDCWFSDFTIDALDSPNDGDRLDDYIRADFTINSTIPNDLTRVEVWLTEYFGGQESSPEIIDNLDCIITSHGLEGSYTFSVPDNASRGNYSFEFRLYNSTGRINKIVFNENDYNDTSGESDVFELYHPFGYTKNGKSVQILDNRITGSVFKMNENGTADNITALVLFPLAMPPVKSKCMIYRLNDSKLIGETEEFIGKTLDGGEWLAYNFSEPKPVLDKDTEYVLVCWCDNVDTGGELYYDIYEDERGRYDNEIYGNPPPYADFSNEGRLYSIYCSYTPKSDKLYYFNNYSSGEVWTSNPGLMVDGTWYTYASTSFDGDVELCDGNTCDTLYSNTIVKVELRVCSYYEGSQRNTILRPVFGGTTDGSEYVHETNDSRGNPWSPWFDITEDNSAPESWDWTDVSNLDCDVKAEYNPIGGLFTLYCSKVEIRVTYE